MITKRQEEILNWLVQDFIVEGEPISSDFLEQKHHLEIAPATVRLDFKKLTGEGYLRQPHTSSGRIPTDKGYRFYVDRIPERERVKENDFSKSFFGLEEKRGEGAGKISDALGTIHFAAEKLSQITSDLVLGYFPEKQVCFKEGLESVFRKPEMQRGECFLNFLETIDGWERYFEDEFALNGDFKIYIGKENPFPKARNCSIIISECKIPGIPKKKKGVFAILGPTRMAYEENIQLLKSLADLFKE